VVALLCYSSGLAKERRGAHFHRRRRPLLLQRATFSTATRRGGRIISSKKNNAKAKRQATPVKLQWGINGETVNANLVENEGGTGNCDGIAEQDGEEVYKCGGVDKYVWASTESTVAPVSPAAAITSFRVKFSMTELDGTAFTVALKRAEDEGGTVMQLGLDGGGNKFFRASLPGESTSSEVEAEGPSWDVTQPMIFEFTQTGGAVASAKIITDDATYEPWGPMKSFQDIKVKKVGFRPHRGEVYIPTGEAPIPGSFMMRHKDEK